MQLFFGVLVFPVWLPKGEKKKKKREEKDDSPLNLLAAISAGGREDLQQWKAV